MFEVVLTQKLEVLAILNWVVKRFRGLGRGGVVLNVTFQKGYFCIDLSANTLYRKCIKFVPKKGGSSDPSDPPLLTPLRFNPLKGGHTKFNPTLGGSKSFGPAVFPFCSPPPVPVINDRSLMS